MRSAAGLNGRGEGSDFAGEGFGVGVVGEGLGEVVFEGVEFGAGDIALRELADIVEEIAAGDGIADAQGAGADAIGAELFGEPEFGDGFAAGEGAGGSESGEGQSCLF